jgi:PAS domain S-box-containing protein
LAGNISKPFDQAVRTLSLVVFKRGMIIAWITLIIALTVTFSAWYSTKSNIEKTSEERFNTRANEIKHLIIQRMQTYEQVLRGGVGLFLASKQITRNEWREYIKTIQINENYPGILGIGFSVIVNKKYKLNHIRKIRSEGFRSYKIWPDYERDVYTSIIFLEPFDKRNQRAFGYDMFSEPTRKEAMERARDSGKASLSGKVTLVQETDKDVQPGFLMYLPLYKKGADISTVQAKRKAIIGFVYSPFRMNDLMKEMLGRQLQNIKLEIYDGAEMLPEFLMFESAQKDTLMMRTERPSNELITRITINDRQWTLKFVSRSGFEATVDIEKPLIVLVLGILISSLLFVVTRNLTNTYFINRKLEQLLESTVEGVFGIDRNGRCTFINNSAAKMLGYEIEEILKKDIKDLIQHTKEEGSFYPPEECHFLITMKTQKGYVIDNEVFWRKDGTAFPVEYSSYPIIDNGETTGAVVAFTDISDRKRTLAQLEASLSEKEVLLREIHHRVKNNLQIISSMLNLQTSSVRDKHSLEILEESKNRVRSMALIHEKLYQNQTLARLNLKDYVSDLVDNLMKSYKANQTLIEPEIQVDAIYLSADLAVPLGLIINELVSNSLKHAFPSGSKGKIALKIKSDLNGKIKLRVEDNGIGLPENFDCRQSDSLGLQLVVSLVNQLNGEINFNGKEGTQVEIIFQKTDSEDKKNFITG